MCEDCRITDQFARDDNPFKLGERPRMRNTDDDLRERELARANPNGEPRSHKGCRGALSCAAVISASIVMLGLDPRIQGHRSVACSGPPSWGPGAAENKSVP